MCRVRGVRLICACKDVKCMHRREFLDWGTTKGLFLYRRGHGWQSYIPEIDELCEEGQKLIDEGKMKWTEEDSNKVDEVIGHAGLEVVWEYKKVNDAGVAVLCDHCKERNHRVTAV